ncbi:ferroxidase fet3 [Coemansia sp. RSA 2706]|nr:ferroxidase fet3 [Coemansia sp. RSA 2706]
MSDIWKAVGVNGTLPIAPIYVDEGDILELNVYNSLDKPISVHSHGLFFKNATYYDGAGMVTECGIPPNESFTYIIDTGGQTGTFWIHGHHHSELSDGLRAPFIIREKVPAVQYDEDILIALEDWQRMRADDLTNLQQSVPLASLGPNNPTALINGINGNTTQPIHFVPGRRYRLRVVSMSGTYWFKVRLPGHTLEIIEGDGTDTEPAVVDGLDLCPGQRYSVLVTAHNTDAFNYAFNVTFYSKFFNQIAGLDPRHYEIPLVYRPNALTRKFPVVEDSELTWSDDFALVPRDKQPLLAPVDRQIVLTEREHDHENGIGSADIAFGDYAYSPGLVPSLFTALTTGALAGESAVYGPQANAFVVQHMHVVEIVLNNPNNRYHSFHMHGHAFQIVEVGPLYSPTGPKQNKTAYQRARRWPMRRDTVTLASHSYLIVRFLASNPGVFLAHCHQAQHVQSGMAFTVVVAPDRAIRD